MKRYRKLLYLALCSVGFLMYSCEEYLDKSLEADITEDQIFSTFPTFQGFVEKMYYDIIDFTYTGNTSMDFNWGDDTQYQWDRTLQEGNYRFFSDNGSNRHPYTYYFHTTERGCYINGTAYFKKGVWNNGWPAIRDANIALSRLGSLVTATEEEKQLLEGQAYFFRGYFHWAIMKQWGGLPYIDKVYSPSDEMKVPKLGFYDCANKVLADLERAAELLPVSWDSLEVGQVTLGQNRMRLNKGMALSMLAEVNLWCGSPMVHGFETGSYTYNTAYLEGAADAAWKVIELANQGVYRLRPWAEYSEIFRKNNRTEPGMGGEVIFKAYFQGRYARYETPAWVLPHLGGGTVINCPTQNSVEWFEMKNTGLPIDDPESGFDPTDPWTGRDPRFDYNIVVDKERIVVSASDARAFAQFYVGGRDKTVVAGTKTGFCNKKYLFPDWNSIDAKWGSNDFICLPIIRLAEIYLIYAEAVNEVYGPNGKVPEADITAVDAVNLIRARAGMPNVHTKFTSLTEDFRERIRIERSVELYQESKRRDDIRRWYVAHLQEYKDLYACDFPEDHSYFEKRVFKTIVFDKKHYWFPFPTAQTLLYDDWPQNPGW